MKATLLSLAVLVIVFAGLTALVMLIQRARALLRGRTLKSVADTMTLRTRTKEWKDKLLMKTLTGPLLVRGFTDIGAYTVAEMPGVSLRLLFQPADMALVVVYEHSKAGHWIEIISYFDDGTSVTYSTNPSAILTARPGFVRFKGLGLNPGALYTKFKTDRPGKPLKTLTPEAAIRLFVTAYADETAWRKQRGIPPDELSAVYRVRNA